MAKCNETEKITHTKKKKKKRKKTNNQHTIITVITEVKEISLNNIMYLKFSIG